MCCVHPGVGPHRRPHVIQVWLISSAKMQKYTHLFFKGAQILRWMMAWSPGRWCSSSSSSCFPSELPSPASHGCSWVRKILQNSKESSSQPIKEAKKQASKVGKQSPAKCHVVSLLRPPQPRGLKRAWNFCYITRPILCLPGCCSKTIASSWNNFLVPDAPCPPPNPFSVGKIKKRPPPCQPEQRRSQV